MKKIQRLLLVSSLLIIAAMSCKKENTPDPAPANTTTTPTTPTYGTFHIDIALVDRTDWTPFAAWGTVQKAYIVCNGNRIDSLTSLTIQTYNSDPYPFSSTFLANANGKDFKVQDGADNYLEIYNDGIKVASSFINRTSSRLERVYMGDPPSFAANYSNYAGGYPVLCTPTW